MNYLKRFGYFAIAATIFHLTALTIGSFTGLSYDSVRLDILSAVVLVFVGEILYESKK